MNDERHLPGMPTLDRQERPVARDADGRPLRPGRVPETRPTPLQDSFIYISLVGLVCGVIAISALELGARLASPVVRIPVLVGGLLLVLVTIDAIVRIWRSAGAWLAVDRGASLFRMVWIGVLLVVLAALLAAMWLVLVA
ncbi:MAG: hypothetical protein H0X16_09400 [Chloroflexi bacterium]|nr:hypothetical protein [Chloroflexota bacterium]